MAAVVNIVGLEEAKLEAGNLPSALQSALNGSSSMTGIQYVTDEEGNRLAVQIDLQKYAKLWEDFEDVLLSKERLKGPRTSVEQFVSETSRYSFENALKFWSAHKTDLSHFKFDRDEANER